VKSSFFRIGVILLSLSVLTGCATTSQSIQKSSSSALLQQQAQDELNSAWKKYNNRQYHEAIPNLLHLLSRYLDTPASIESRYLLALCYYQVEGYKDSIDLFNDYLKLAPQGKYAAESRQHIAKISIAYEAQFPSDTRTKSEITRLENELASTPQSVTLKIKLADQYWQLGSYAQAGDLYVNVVQADPAFRRNQTFNERIDLHDDGTFTLITPKEQTKRSIEKDPLVIINTNSFRSGRDILTATRKFYVVSGQVVNRSNETKYGAEVVTTIFGFGNVVWDTNSYNIAQIRPGETRAFSFRFQNFRNINDINNYECKVTYQR
jgi:tetratricopeptide (TPR) repeat protein